MVNPILSVSLQCMANGIRGRSGAIAPPCAEAAPGPEAGHANNQNTDRVPKKPIKPMPKQQKAERVPKN